MRLADEYPETCTDIEVVVLCESCEEYKDNFNFDDHICDNCMSEYLFEVYPEQEYPPESNPIHGESHIHSFQGLLVRVDIIEYADGHIDTEHTILEYTCWDGKYPF